MSGYQYGKSSAAQEAKRIIAAATAEADELVTQARRDAIRIVSEARATATRITSELAKLRAKAEAEVQSIQGRTRPQAHHATTAAAIGAAEELLIQLRKRSADPVGTGRERLRILGAEVAKFDRAHRAPAAMSNHPAAIDHPDTLAA